MIPVEVQAGTAGSLRSLHQFLARDVKGAGGAALRFDLNLPNISAHHHRLLDGRPVAYRVLSLPLYLVEQSERLLDAVLEGSA